MSRSSPDPDIDVKASQRLKGRIERKGRPKGQERAAKSGAQGQTGKQGQPNKASQAIQASKQANKANKQAGKASRQTNQTSQARQANKANQAKQAKAVKRDDAIHQGRALHQGEAIQQGKDIQQGPGASQLAGASQSLIEAIIGEADSGQFSQTGRASQASPAESRKPSPNGGFAQGGWIAKDIGSASASSEILPLNSIAPDPITPDSTALDSAQEDSGFFYNNPPSIEEHRPKFHLQDPGPPNGHEPELLSWQGPYLEEIPDENLYEDAVIEVPSESPLGDGASTEAGGFGLLPGYRRSSSLRASDQDLPRQGLSSQDLSSQDLSSQELSRSGSAPLEPAEKSPSSENPSAQRRFPQYSTPQISGTQDSYAQNPDAQDPDALDPDMQDLEFQALDAQDLEFRDSYSRSLDSPGLYSQDSHSQGDSQDLYPHDPAAPVYKPLEDIPVYSSRPVRIGEIIDTILERNPEADDNLVRRAYVFAATAHHGMTRRSEEPYLNHPLAVASILCDMRLDISSIAAGLLHDTVEDTSVTIEDIRREFGNEVAVIVDGVTKISKFQFSSATEREASNMRKMILAMLTDLRVILVKLADRLNNMRTLGFMPPDKQLLIAKETMEIFAPLASRLGIHKIQSELEDLSLFYLEPQTYGKLRRAISEGRNDRKAYVAEVKSFLSTKISEFGIKAEVEGRPKHIYSIWRKMRSQNLPFEQIYDLVAFRIIVDQVQECYSALGVIHSIFKPIPGRFKDYISLPKNNGYRSLHTAVIGLKSMRMEIQIRTREMHSYAEDGIAAHWRYKDGGRVSDVESQRIGALRAILSWQSSLQDPTSFIASIKESLAEKDAIYVFTPNGDVRELPLGATPIDFAYFIHTEIGNHCSGARINGVMASIRQKLQNGDTVEIITSRVSTPSQDWLRHVASPKAKAKIRQWLGAEERKQALEFGRALITQEMRRHKIGRHRLSGEVLASLGYNDFDDLNVAVAYSKLPVMSVIAAMLPEAKIQPAQPQQEKERKQKAQGGAAEKPSPKIMVKGVGDVFVRHGKCCAPVPGEPIMGFLTQGNGVTVHSADCKSLMGLDPERLVEVSWENDPNDEFAWEVHVRVKISKVRGAYSRVVSAISDNCVDISEAHAGDAGSDRPWFKVAVKDYSQYQAMISALKAMPNIVEMVERFHPDDPLGVETL